MFSQIIPFFRKNEVAQLSRMSIMVNRSTPGVSLPCVKTLKQQTSTSCLRQNFSEKRETAPPHEGSTGNGIFLAAV